MSLRRPHLVAALVLCGVVVGPAAAAPMLTGGGLTPSGWTPSTTAGVTWTQAGMESEVSAHVSVEVNAAADGTGSGAWLVAFTDPLSAVSGPRTAPVDTSPLEGRHFARVVVRTPLGLVASLPLGVLMVDRTAPAISTRPASHTPQASTLRWTEEDPASGLDPGSPHVLEVNSSSAGDAAGTWAPVATLTPAAADGLVSATIASGSLTDGTHLARVRTSDQAGNEAVASVGVAYSDRSAPAVSVTRVLQVPSVSPQAAEISFTVADAAPGSGVGAGSPARVTDPTGTAVLWDGLLDGSTPQRVRIHLPGLLGDRAVVRVTDRAGNIGASAPVDISPQTASTVAAGAGSPSRRGHGPTATVRLTRVTPAAMRYGSRVAVTGRASGPAGRALGRATVEIRDGAGALAEATTDSRGRFHAMVVPRTSGRLRAQVVDRRGRERLTTVRGGVALVVTPAIAWRLSSTSPRAGGSPLVVSGRILPEPRVLPGKPTKRVMLEWLDPLRGSWRPVVDAQASADGRFHLSWRFGAGGFSVPVRVAVPDELGWPLVAARTESATVRVAR